MAQERTGFETASKDIGGVGQTPNNNPGLTVHDPAMNDKLKAMGSQGAPPPIPVAPITDGIKLPPFVAHESRKRDESFPDTLPGYVALDKLPYEHPDFMRRIRADYRMQISIWVDEPCPVWFVKVTKPGGLRMIQNHTEAMVTGLEFTTWFWPEYQIHRDFGPEEIDPAEWTRMKRHLLNQCFRHPSQAPLPGKDGKPKFSGGSKKDRAMEMAHDKFKLWGIYPKIWVGAKVEYEMTAKPRTPLLEVIGKVMINLDISFQKTSYTPTDVSKVAEALVEDASLYGIEDEIGSHFKSGDDNQPADWILIPLMQQAAKKQKDSNIQRAK